jgi:hypothetical protein
VQRSAYSVDFAGYDLSVVSLKANILLRSMHQ